MKDWEYTFPAVSKEEWIAQIQKDLKQTSMESLHKEWWPGEKINPIHYSPGQETEVVALPDAFFLHPPLLTEWVEAKSGNEAEVNKHILHALERGAQSIICNIASESDLNLAQITNEVYPDMIEFGFNIKSDSLEHFTKIVLPAGVHLRIDREQNSSVDVIQSLKNLFDHSGKDILISYSLRVKENWIEAATQMFQTIIEDFIKHEALGLDHNFLSSCRIMIRPDGLYFKQIVQTRVIQLVWLNLLASLGHQEKLSSPVECHITPRLPTDPDRYIIAASSSSLAAALTGVRAICIHHLDHDDVPKFYRRIDLNIQHLLQLESGIYTGTDPVSGSYALDHYTRKWSEEIWEKVSGLDVMNFRQKG